MKLRGFVVIVGTVNQIVKPAATVALLKVEIFVAVVLLVTGDGELITAVPEAEISRPNRMSGTIDGEDPLDIT